jgi:hypothetical protein
MTEQQAAIKALRPKLTQALHVLRPDLPLIDCARVANAVLDGVEIGDLDGVHRVVVQLDAALAASGRVP